MVSDDLWFDQALAFGAGFLTPILPLAGLGKPLLFVLGSGLLGGVIALRAYRNTAFGDRQAEKRAERLVTTSEAALLPDHPADPAISVSRARTVNPTGYVLDRSAVKSAILSPNS